MELRFKRWPGSGDDVPLPAYATEGAAAFDIRAAVPPGAVLVIAPGARAVVDTGLSVAVPPGHELQVRPRSGTALKHGVTVLNSPGTVDSDYRGQLKVLLVNLGQEPFPVRRGDRVAQGVLSPVLKAVLREVDELDDTPRGAGGFGSTGLG